MFTPIYTGEGVHVPKDTETGREKRQAVTCRHRVNR